MEPLLYADSGMPLLKSVDIQTGKTGLELDAAAQKRVLRIGISTLRAFEQSDLPLHTVINVPKFSETFGDILGQVRRN